MYTACAVVRVRMDACVGMGVRACVFMYKGEETESVC